MDEDKRLIADYNRLMADFMGYDGINCSACFYFTSCNQLQCDLKGEEKDNLLEYHRSWDWLMPVVDRIRERIGHKLIEDTSACERRFASLHITAPMREVYACCLSYIKMHAQVKKKT